MYGVQNQLPFNLTCKYFPGLLTSLMNQPGFPSFIAAKPGAGGMAIPSLD